VDTLKTWIIEIAVKKLGPSAIRAMVLGAASWFIARENLLSAYGIVSDAAAHTTTIHWDQVSSALIVGLPAVIAVIVRLTQHTTAAVVTGAPQSGDTKLEQRRAGDPPVA
jgi:hypothetical protein